jgi:signal transduction histidine kinase
MIAAQHQVPWFARSAGRAGVEALAGVAAAGVMLFLMRDGVQALLLWQAAFLLAGPLAICWLAARWRLTPGGRVRRIIVESLTMIAWSELLLAAILIVMGFIHRYPVATPQERQSSFWSAAIFFAFVGLLARGVARSWHSWEALRARRLAWSLTFTYLIVLGAGAVTFFACALLLDLILLPSFILKLLPDAIFLLAVTAVTLIVLLPLIALASFLATRRTLRRLSDLAVAAAALRQGNLASRAIVTGSDEIADLQRAFNAMAGALSAAMSDLGRERDRVASLLAERRELMAAISHDLRTPLATTRAYAEALIARMESGDATTARDDLATMLGEVEHLQMLVDDLFRLSQAEVGKLPLHCAPHDVRSIADRVARAAAPLAWASRRVTVSAELPDDLPLADVDEQRIEQVLHNLVNNAVRHTPPGGMVVVCAREDESTIALSVRDTGSGISPGDLAHIWDRFYQGDGDRRARSGAGLGLALVREWTEAMGGSVAVTSQIGEGSCFTVKVPRA